MMPNTKKRKASSRQRTLLALISIIIILVIAGMGTLLFIKTNTAGIAGDQTAEKTIQIIEARVSVERVPYSSSPYRYAQEAGAYMRPIKLPGYNYMVFPTQAYLVKLKSPSQEQTIETLLGKGYTRKVIVDKSVQKAVEYDSKKVVCYLEVPKTALNQTTIFGCADVSSYVENAQKIKPFADLSRWVGGADTAFDTPFSPASQKPGYQVAFLPSTGTPGLMRPSNLDAMERYELSSANVAFYQSPSTNGWTLIGYGGFTTVDQLCSSQYTQTADIQMALENVCKSQSWN